MQLLYPSFDFYYIHTHAHTQTERERRGGDIKPVYKMLIVDKDIENNTVA